MQFNRLERLRLLVLPGSGTAWRLATIAAVMALLVATAAASAQDWPTRPMTLVVPLAAGGSSDAIARIVADGLRAELGQPVLVQNVGGAGGMLGSSRVAKARPDGYQFVLGNVGTHAQNQSVYRKPLYNPATDFTPVGLVVDQTLASETVRVRAAGWRIHSCGKDFGWRCVRGTPNSRRRSCSICLAGRIRTLELAKKIIPHLTSFAPDLSLEPSMHGGHGTPSLTGSLLSTASAIGPPRGLGGGGAMLRSVDMSKSKRVRTGKTYRTAYGLLCLK
jgi:hypothetical protein